MTRQVCERCGRSRSTKYLRSRTVFGITLYACSARTSCNEHRRRTKLSQPGT
jgi:hypothetical protein